MDDRELREATRAAARGDQAAAARLFDHTYPRIYRYALAKIGRVSDAEDIAAETFARALRDLDRFRWKGAGVEAWLFRIAYNLIVDHFRDSARERAGPVTDEGPTHLSDGTPETHFIQHETASEVSAMLDRLPPDQREVLVLRFSAELSTHEVAAVMHRNVNAIRQLQFRALENLRNITGQEAIGT